ncbi:MAG TPA: ABC transporter ATP-binding protein [Candidatus Ornithospirochaeta stercorigallinarum]|nr:ABC transporter ATP-binding protein [Candidatus Ornithospirochaeta stercorigallinarum]
MSVLIKGEHIDLGYEGEAIVKDISFSISEGDYLCILGENGAGKSTLVKAILSLHAPLKGEIEFSPQIRKNEIGYLPQQSSAQKSFPASVEEVVLSGRVNSLSHKFFYTKEDRKIALSNLSRLGIENLRRKSFSELSGGQMQRVLLARALCACKKLLLLDEPVTGLDPHTTSEFYRMVDDLNDDGLTIIMVTHDIHPALNSTDHVMYLGRGYFYGRKDDYFKSEMGMRFLKEAGHHD